MGLSTAEVDKKLDDVATAMMSGKNNEALKILSLVIDYGDDVQREMAESYKLQIEMMIELESQNDFVDVSTERTNAFIADENLVELTISDACKATFDENSFVVPDEFDSVLSECDESSECPDSLIKVNSTERKSNELYDLISSQETSASHSLKEQVDSLECEAMLDDVSIVVDGVEDGNYSFNVPAPNVSDDLAVEFTDAFEQDESLLEASNINNKNAEDSNFSFRSSISDNKENEFPLVLPEKKSLIASKGDQEEIKLTHEQVEFLIDDDEFETAQIVLSHVIGLGCEEQQQRADELDALIKKKLSLQCASDELKSQSNIVVKEYTSEIFNNNEKTPDDQSFIDSIFKDDFSASESFDQGDFKVNEQEKVELIKSQLDAGTVGHTKEVESLELLGEDVEVQSTRDTGLILNQEAFNSISKRAEKNILEDSSSIEEDCIDNLLLPSDVLGKDSVTNLSTEINRSEDIVEKNKEYSERQGFIVGGIGMMIAFEDGSELTSMPKYFRVPNSPGWLVGLTNLHGLVIPIVNLEEYFGLQQSDSVEKSMLLVLNHGERAVGVIIHGLPERFVWSNEEKVSLNTCPKTIRNHVNSALKINDGLWFDMNVDSLTDVLMDAA